MTKMEGNLGELLSAVAVLASVVYLAIQIRSNSKQARIANVQRMLEASREMMLISGRDEFIHLLQKEKQDKDALSEQETVKVRMLRMAQLKNVENAYILYSKSFGNWLREIRSEMKVDTA